MSTKKSVSKPDDLVESKIKGGDIELTEHELGQVAGGAAVDYFLKIDGVDGESTDDKHKGEIELQSFSLGKTRTKR
jgi:Type VI secretion system effector, Hcp